MHFWIDKRSQCTYTGRHRVPTSLSAGCYRSVGGRRSRAGECRAPRRKPRTARARSAPGAVSVPAVHSTRRQEDAAVYVDTPPQPTIASLAAARSVTPDTLIRTAALGLQQSPVMAPHLKFGMLVSFALATVFLAGARYYFDKPTNRASVVVSDSGPTTRGSRGNAGAACALAACVCGAAAALALCRRRGPALPPFPPDRVSSTALRAATLEAESLGESPVSVVSTSGLTDGVSVVGVGSQGLRAARGPGGGEGAGEAPPPYHIAVLLPAPAPPPPAYSALA